MSEVQLNNARDIVYNFMAEDMNPRIKLLKTKAVWGH